MLLRFRAQNHLSIGSAQELSFIASKLKDSPDHLLPYRKTSVLPAIGLYGANASGKSNLLSALSFFVEEIAHSQTRRSAGDAIPRQPFLLSPATAAAPSAFDCDVVLDGVRYHYGFSVDDDQVREEWLYAWPGSRKQAWFQRDCSEEEPFHFGSKLSGHNQRIAEFVRPDSLFLSAAAQHNHAQLTPLYRYFKEAVVVDMDIDKRANRSRFESDATSTSRREKMIALIRAADVGITDIRVKSREAERAKLRKLLLRLSAEWKENPDNWLSQHIEGEEIPDNLLPQSLWAAAPLADELQIGHQAAAGPVYFDFSQESVGTRTLLSLIGPISRVIEDGGLLAIDEIDSSIHPILACELIKLFNDPLANPIGGQLLFTTHDTNLLHALRRDQVWFTEKSRTGETMLYPLTDYQLRRGDNLERGYLQGRFGAVPVLGSFARILSSAEPQP